MSSKETAEAILLVFKKLGKWILIALLVLMLLFLGLFAYDRIESYYKNRPQVVVKLKGIELGERFEDFMFRNSGFVLDEERNQKASQQVFYENKDKSTFVRIESGKVIRVVYKCTGERDYTNVNGIECGASGDEVLSKYDKKVNVKCLKDKSSSDYLKYRVYDAMEFGVRYHVVANEIVAFDVASAVEISKLDGHMNTNWTSCE